MVYGTCNYSYWGESKPTYSWGGHIVEMVGFSTSMLVCVSWEQKDKHGAGTNIKNHQDRIEQGYSRHTT